MGIWLFVLVVLGFGVGLALYVDRLKSRTGSVAGEPRQVSERSRWLHYWFTGRFPEDERKKRK